MIEADLHQTYGLDVGDRALMHTRSWRWLSTRIAGLFGAETRVHRHFFPPPPPPDPNRR
ncbi:hypothetical protein SAMN04489727_5738 [Amycolatopsis tolypomycina]|uniref:Uncharacterized protein n=1 Tax=Amycolatopsis tolypomycina TaxID=208445 RepID=A0A1H4WPZ5_9PSEU|nr:hypothetical protein [Amycolatopsis tolypomycina]SEC95409.1 hypothetical protein SAMN04489727_5738 [Amycolatopsis tolypomycina]